MSYPGIPDYVVIHPAHPKENTMPDESLSDDDMTTTPADEPQPMGDADGTDGGDADGTDGGDADGTDADGTDGDASDSTDGDAS
jgi:hypothetical protein